MKEMVLKMSVGVMIGIVSVMGVMLYLKNQTISTLESDKITLSEKVKTKQSQLDALNIIIASNASDQGKRDRLPIEITKIQTKYVPIEKEIIKWKEEANASDCNAAMEHIDNFVY